jgi:hypothetical protein
VKFSPLSPRGMGMREMALMASGLRSKPTWRGTRRRGWDFGGVVEAEGEADGGGGVAGWVEVLAYRIVFCELLGMRCRQRV